MPLFELSCIYRDFSGATAQKAFNFKRFRRIQSIPKLPSKITKLPLTHKTRNQFVGNSGTWVRIPPRPPKKISDFFGDFFDFILIFRKRVHGGILALTTMSERYLSHF